LITGVHRSEQLDERIANGSIEWPFTRHLGQIAENGSSGTEGFSWTDSGIGLFAGIGVALTAAAALMLTRKTRHPRTT
jgi:hypothetical protein